jgi:hypothetical protein
MDLHWASKFGHIFYTSWINDGYYGCHIEIRIDENYHKKTKIEIIQELIDVLGMSPEDSHYFKIYFQPRVTPDESWKK